MRRTRTPGLSGRDADQGSRHWRCAATHAGPRHRHRHCVVRSPVLGRRIQLWTARKLTAAPALAGSRHARAGRAQPDSPGPVLWRFGGAAVGRVSGRCACLTGACARASHASSDAQPRAYAPKRARAVNPAPLAACARRCRPALKMAPFCSAAANAQTALGMLASTLSCATLRCAAVHVLCRVLSGFCEPAMLAVPASASFCRCECPLRGRGGGWVGWGGGLGFLTLLHAAPGLGRHTPLASWLWSAAVAAFRAKRRACCETPLPACSLRHLACVAPAGDCQLRAVARARPVWPAPLPALPASELPR